MKEFIFTITETYTTDYYIQAETEEQARRIGGAWGTDRADRWLPREIRDEIDEIFSEYYNATRY